MSRRNNRRQRKQSITSSESLNDEEILEYEKHDYILDQMNKTDQLKQAFEIPELDQQGISSDSEEIDDESDFEEEGAVKDVIKVDNDPSSREMELLDYKLLENLKLVDEFDLREYDSDCSKRLYNFQNAYKAAVLFYFYNKSRNKEEVTEHPVIKQITQMNNMIPFYIDRVNK